jgi:DNA-directed RNA polymerase specialized sigma subunit
MTQLPDYTRNHELFTRFYALQGCFTDHLAARPGLLRAWLEALPPREPDAAESAPAVRIWRTARLSSARRRELSCLVMRAEARPDEAAPLALWLLVSVPVCTLLEMAAAPGLEAPVLGAEAGDCHRRLLELRETLFLANYGLAKAAAKRRRPQDYAEMLGAASDGLLDAIDRYVPDGRAARFAYFAGYWIRYHMARQFQKSGSVVSFPVNQHRIGRRIRRFLANREANVAPPSPAELCQELQLGRAAYFWQQQRPQVVSLHGSASAEPEAPAMELRLCDPAPEPADLLEQAEIAERLRELLHAQAGPAARLMLAYVHGVGPLADAAEDYLASLQDLARSRLSASGDSLQRAASGGSS